LLFVTAAAVLLAGCGGGAPSQPAGASVTAAPSASPVASESAQRKVLVIVEENKTLAQAIGRPEAPYLSALATRFGLATEMAAGYPSECPSLPAYILMTSGVRRGLCDNGDPADHPIRDQSIFTQVAESGREWRSYAESMPRNCHLTNSSDGRYLVRHVPATYYLADRARCRQWTVPLGSAASGSLQADLAAGELPSFSMITPDACNDMHGAADCAESVAIGDRWLKLWVPKILASPDYQSGRLVVMITWDEGTPDNNHIPTVVISPASQGITAPTAWTHCSSLRTWEELLGLPLLGCAQKAPSMRAAFRL
jgi:phosphatidylinositol-3-phosphatase